MAEMHVSYIYVVEAGDFPPGDFPR